MNEWNVPNVLIMILAAILPAFLLVGYICFKDRKQPEPFSLIMRGMLYGLLSAAVAIGIDSLLLYFHIIGGEPQTLQDALMIAFVGAAIPEEGAKLLMLWLLLRKNPYFDERFDGIVYAVCIGMGFAGTENIFYLLSSIENWQSVAIQRAIFSVPGHFMFAVAMGYLYSKVAFDKRWYYIPAIYFLPVLLHGIFDSLLLMITVEPILTYILLPIFYIFIWKMFKRARRRIAKLI